MSTLKCTVIIIIVAAYLHQWAYAVPPEDDKIALPIEAVDCINKLAAFFKIPNPYISPDDDKYVPPPYVSSAQDEYVPSPYLNRNEVHYIGDTTLSKLILVKSTIAHLKNEFTETNMTTRYHKWLKLSLLPTNIKLPSNFCEENNSFIQNVLDCLPFARSKCMRELAGFPNDSPGSALNYAFENVVLSEFSDYKYGTAYMKHLIRDVMIDDSLFVIPEDYCKIVDSNIDLN